MREIKFRAWDEQNKIMHNEVEFIRSGTEKNDWILFKSDKQKLECENVLNNPYFQQQIKIMQFTGLFDKNGVEIYEGDIVKAYIDSAYILSAIKYIQDSFMVSMFTITTYHSIEIIGNIYENPELLKEDK